MINFNKDSFWNLHPIDKESVREDVKGLLIEGEEIMQAFKTIRDQVIFTTKRIIAVDVQGITGMRRSFSSMPYSTIQFFTIQTPGFIELVHDSELLIYFSNGFKANFEFSGTVDIGEICRTISKYTLG
ncbi:MAG: PH domain-containing protein [Firmicutes bacterium]|nr:PH domain-containing protein [Bacillota bacterium]MBQ1525244.1 PH domain-containing protein [Bacillota bacterium]MBQ1888446.1 PH domain-containing protein [Bacillota bacterium]MBQ2455453.1 PH domain-containing protein [Bacillota bacterium]MBQ3579346.1 PH domain-containing protein [Bacillota bacterium]